jgi:hypothetical protein
MRKYAEAVEYFKKALRDEQTWLHNDRTNRYRTNLRAAESALKAEKRALKVQREVDARIALASKQKQQEELARAKKYSSLPAPPSPGPLPQLRVTDLVDRIKAVLSVDLGRAVILARNGASTLPQPARREVSDAIFRYVSEHGIPNEYARTYWTINKGAAADLNAVFEAIRKDLAEVGVPASNTEKAVDEFETNLLSRMSDAAADVSQRGANKP